ncbi:glycosyltransferase family 2 protein [Patescibacteria group bacterium]|nr:glycosyltransferase family 2 protein [Patescibacteria group bacterium]
MKSFVEKNDRFVQRFFEISLGLSTWALLTSPLWLGFLYPEAVVYMLTFLTVYWSYLAFRHTYGLVIGYNKHKSELKIDWLSECKKLDFSELPDKKTLPPSLEDVRHLILVPLVAEPEGVIRDTMGGILRQTFSKKQIVVAFTIEERGVDKVKSAVEKVMGECGHEFHDYMIYVHPAGIPGEAVGVAAANRTWGSKNAVVDLEKKGENIRNYIYSSIDGDHIIHPQYISRLTHLYLSSDNRDNHYYSTAVPLFDNNLWRVPLMMRIEASAVTMGVLSDWIVTKKTLKDTFSAFSISLKTLIEADYWDVTLGVDDTIFYWRAFFAKGGKFDGLPHFIPYSADAVEGRSYWESHKSLYKQLLRWGWGVIDFPLSMKGFLKDKRVAFSKKMGWFIKHIQKRVVFVNIVFLITFGFGLVTVVNPLVKQSNFAYSLPDIMSTILTVTLIFLIPGTIYRFKLSGPIPKEFPWWKKLLVYLEGPLIILNLLTFSFIPTIEAQTRLLLGKKKDDLYFTPKVR